MSSSRHDAFNTRGALLFAAIARDPADQALATEFNTFFYPVVLHYVRKRHRSLPAEITRLTGTTRPVPELDAQDIEEAAHATAWLALEGARASAGRFDLTRGSATGWVLRAAAYAYIGVAKELARGSRRSVLRELMESDELEQTLDNLRQDDDPAELAAGQAMVDAAFAILSEQEQQAVVLKMEGYTQAESAMIMFKDPTQTRRVEHLLRRARSKVGGAWDDLKATGAAPGLDSPPATDDKELT